MLLEGVQFLELLLFESALEEGSEDGGQCEAVHEFVGFWFSEFHEVVGIAAAISD